MKKWVEMNTDERDQLIAEKVMGWYKREISWYKVNNIGVEEGPFELPSFSSDDSLAFLILRQFNSYQVTKMFPTKYRTIIDANNNRVFSENLLESICLAALKARGIDI